MTIQRGHFLIGASAAATAALVPAELMSAVPTHVLEIEETAWEFRPGLFQRTTTAGGTYPGTPIRVTQGSTIDVAVRNRTKAAVAIHWHGLVVSSQVDGVPELGTPPVEPGRTRSYRLPITVGGTRWYHMHNGKELLFGGLAGAFIVDRKKEPGDYDREVVLMLHEFKPTIPAHGSMVDERPTGAPALSAPATSHVDTVQATNQAMAMSGPSEGDGSMSPNMAMRDVHYASYAINGKALGFGNPVRVKRKERVRFRVINASATLTHRLALSGHSFHVIELDGNPVPTQRGLDAIELGPGERVDAIVTMDSPGIWILGSTEATARQNGLGIVIAYDGETGQPVWRKPSSYPFHYELFGSAAHGLPDGVDGTYDVVLRKSPETPDAWSINSQLFPRVDPLKIREGGSYLLRFRNPSMMEHPMHVHGHSFELVSIDGNRTSGIFKDTVVVRPQGGRIDVLLRANNPYRGRFLLHCHNDQHVEGGMATVLAYRSA